MLIPNHPHDERLSALASGDPEAVADSALSEHVASCLRCTDTVAELGALRASLAELPDLRPHRPLQLLPPVAEVPPSRVDRVSGWARRFFAPVLTAGAALAMVGLVGTTAPLLPMGQAGSDSGATIEMENAAEAPEGEDAYTFEGTAEPRAVTGEATDGGADEPAGMEPLQSSGDASALDETGREDSQRVALSDERPIWPMLLFAGVAIMIAAALMRWVLAPRTG